MRAEGADDPIGALLNLHHILEVEHDDGDKGNFLFGWQCENPFADDLIARTVERSRLLNRVQYSYLEEDAELIEKIKRLHQALDGQRPIDAFCGVGATALLVTCAAHFRAEGIEEVYFIPPIYFSLHFAMRLFNIRARPVSSRHAFECNFTMNLPEKRTFLLLTDPVWYAGVPVPQHILEEIAQWQARTGSTVLIDGSFQYMPWNKRVFEATSLFDPSMTIRLISPSKSLCVAGYRFAYLLMPESLRRKISNIYTNIYASASVDTIAFGHEAINAMETRAVTNKLTDVILSRHRKLRADGKTESELSATCGYFVFEKLNHDLPPQYIRIGGEFFDQARYPGYTRINLLSPSFHLLE